MYFWAKILLISLLALAMIFTICSCTAPAAPETPDTADAPPASETPDAPPESEEPEAPPAAELPVPAVDYIPTPSDLREASEMEPLGVLTPDKLAPSTELPVGAISLDLKGKPTVPPAIRAYDITIHKDVVYRTVNGRDLITHILVPDGITEGPYPLIIYIQGSAFMGNAREMIGMGVASMLTVAEQGYAVAILEHRGTMPMNGGARFPEQNYDVKTAIRFLRMSAEEYNIDPDRFAIWGNSSGAYHAVFAGVTGDDSFTEGEYSEYSSEVNVIISEYGPSRLLYMSYAPSNMDHAGPMSPEGGFSGGVNLIENPEKAEEASTTTYITDAPIPPILLLHGSADYTVPFNQSVRMYEHLKALGHETTFYKLEGDGHGTFGFMTQEVRQIILDYIAKYI